MEIIDLQIELPDKSNVLMMFDAVGTITDVLKKVCKEFKLKHDDYELRYEGRAIEGEKVLWDCGFPLGAKLSLAVIHKSPVIPVELINQGTRSTHYYSPTATLWEVCEDFMKNKPNPNQPVQISFLGHCFNGNDVLNKTKLTSLSRRKDKIVLQLEKKWTHMQGVVDEKNNNSKCFSSTIRQKNTAIIRKPTRMNKGETPLAKALNNGEMSKPEKLEDNKVDDKRSLNQRRGETAQKPFMFPRHVPSMKGITSVDTNHYTSSWEKPNRILHLDERKGLTYSLRNKGTFGKPGLALLGLNENTNNRSFISMDNETQLKIVFPQQTVIQASFLQNETLEDVYSFLSSFVKSSNFVLCGSKEVQCDLDRSTHVKDLQCMPEGTLFVRYTSDTWKNKLEPISMHLLKPQLLSYKGRQRIWKLK